MRHIIKRNGSIVAFSQDKITHAINKSFISVNKEDPSKIQNISNQVMAVIEVQFKEDHFPTVEEIQDIVEKILIKNGESEVAKSYILYRDQHQKMRNIENMFVDAEKTMNEYLKKADWRVNANANQGYSLGGLILNSAGKITANYWLSHIYSKEVGQAHRNGDYHIHDLDMFSGYCAGWSLRQLLEEGFNGVANKIDSCPPKHLEAAIGQMVNFLGTLQNEWAGAQAFSSFDTYMAPYVKKYSMEIEEELQKVNASFLCEEDRQKYVDEKTYEYVYQNLQSFVF